MKKLTLIGTALALAFTLSATGCKKKDENKGTETQKPAAGTAAPAPADPAAVAPAAPAAPPAADPAAPPAADPAAPAAPADQAAASTGVPECDEYLATFEKLSKCDKLGPALDGMKMAADAQKATFASWASFDETARKAAQASAGPSCKTLTEGLKTTATSLGCTL
ncbi:MAG: hypothetical protein IPL61_30870 [Myxococcales bacterium]|nr:hypothetical protein [Myxococcales bacterium]